METILVTDGSGFIGPHTVLELLNKGYGVIVMDNLCNSSEEVGGQAVLGRQAL